MPPLGRTLYRELLRFAHRAGDCPFDIRPSHLQEVLPASAFQDLTAGGSRFRDGAGVRALVQTSFRASAAQLDSAAAAGADAPGAEAAAAAQDEALDRAFTALRLLNTGYIDEISERRRQRQARSKRDGVAFAVGQVVYHKRFQYRGVVIGWDTACQRSPEWARQFMVAHNQPFYSVLPDEQDCTRLFGSMRSSKYVAQENLQPLAEGQLPMRVVHRSLVNFFSGWSPSHKRYLAHATTAYEYPMDAVAAEEDAQPCAEDSNLLLHEEIKPQADAEAGPSVVKLRRL